MSLRTLEAEILAELRVVTGNPKIRQKDIMEWTTGDIKEPAAGEKVVRLPKMNVAVAYVEVAKAAKVKP